MNSPEFANTDALFGDLAGFDINAAFQNAMTAVITDTELALDDKVQRIEVMVREGTSEVYRDFVDFRALAAQMELFCMHDQAFSDQAQGHGLLSEFMHDHADHDTDDDEWEIDPKTGKKRKKKRLLDLLLAT